MTPSDFEAPKHEAPRRVLNEEEPELTRDLRRYELHRDQKERDTHIKYARSAYEHISDGMPLSVAVGVLAEEIPQAGFDRNLIVSTLNYFLETNKNTYRFDTNLNVLMDDGVIVSSGTAATLLAEYEQRAADNAAHFNQEFAEKIGQRLLAGISFDIMMQFAKADLVWENMDNVDVSVRLNTYLEANGSSIRINQYFEMTD